MVSTSLATNHNMPDTYDPNLPGSPGTSGSGSPYGTVPQIPDPRTTMLDTINANNIALPNLYELAQKINDFNYQQKLAQILKGDPNFQGQMGQSFSNIEAALKGQVPQDVADVLRNKAASMGVRSGTPGSQFVDFNNLYNYGQTSLDQTRWAENALTNALARLPSTTPFDITSMFLTPDQLQQAKAAANVNQSAPDPTAAATNALNAAAAGMAAGNKSVARPTVSTVPSSGNVTPVGTPSTPPTQVRPVQPTVPPVNTTPGWGQITDPYGRTYYVDNTGNVTTNAPYGGGPSQSQMDQSNPYYGTVETGWAFPTQESTYSPSGNNFASDYNQAALDNLFGNYFDYPSGQYYPVDPTSYQNTIFDQTYWPEDLPSPTDPYSLPGGGAIDPFDGMIMDELGNIYFPEDY